MASYRRRERLEEVTPITATMPKVGPAPIDRAGVAVNWLDHCQQLVAEHNAQVGWTE